MRYEVRAIRSLTADPMGASLFALYRCDVVCLEAAGLAGGIGITGPEVRVAVPLDALGADAGSAVTGLRAFTAFGEAATGALVALDEVELPDAVLPAAQVRLGVAPAGTPASDVDFLTEAGLTAGWFAGSVSTAGLAAGGYKAWARACLGEVCGAASTPVALDG